MSEHPGLGRAAAWLNLAAAPAFALMALLTTAQGDGPTSPLCGAGSGFSLAGMVPMYVLMSVFHAAPWLRLIGSRRQHPTMM
jgi:hypothetical protein